MKEKATWKVKMLFFMILFIIAFLVMVPFMAKVAEKEEKRECIKWQQEAKEMEIYYLLSWQKEQCDNWNIKINAPVMKGGGK